MITMNQIIFRKLFLVLVVFSLYFVFTSTAKAEYKNRLSILAFENPPGWSASYNPGTLITDLLSQTLSGRGNFHLLPPPSRQEKASDLSATPDGKSKMAPMEGEQLDHPAQFILKGRVLHFTPGKPPSRAQIILNIGEALKQRAEIEIELELINHHLKKTLHRKKFQIVSSTGSIPFNMDSTVVNFDSQLFQKSSVGKALLQLMGEIDSYIMATLHPLPLEGEVIAVDAEKKEMIINIGQVHGVNFRDYFNVYSVTLKYKDPFSDLDLGNKFFRRGVIRVKDVQEGFSIASIIAGEDFEQGELVRSQKTNPIFPVNRSGNMPAKAQSLKINNPK